MIDLVLARTDLVDVTSFERLRAALPPERREKSDRYIRRPDRYASVVSFALLQYLWARLSTAPMPEIQRGAQGKPYFDGPDRPHFSLSHDAWLCACAMGPVPVGLDVQSRIPYDKGLFDRMATPHERVWEEQLRRQDDLSGLWTRKEALVKRSGRGLFTPLLDVEAGSARDVITLTCNGLDVRCSLSVEGWSGHDILERLTWRFVTLSRTSAGVDWSIEDGSPALNPVEWHGSGLS